MEPSLEYGGGVMNHMVLFISQIAHPLKLGPCRYLDFTIHSLHL